MSPLAPQVSNTLGLLKATNNAIPTVVEPTANVQTRRNVNGKVVYSITDLMEMRHNQSQAPNLPNRNILASISRSEVAPSTGRSDVRPTLSSKFSSLISFNLGHNPMDDRRHRMQRQHGGHMNNGFGLMGERTRHFNRGKYMFSLFLSFFDSHSLCRPFHDHNQIITYKCEVICYRFTNAYLFFFRFIGYTDRGHTSGASNGISIRLSIKTDVKLKEAENAWKPSHLQKSEKKVDGEADELYKQVRSILNKLTAQNFPILSEQFQSLKIDTKEKLNGVINTVFNKAVNEPNFSEGYAKLCQYLSQCSQRIDSSSTEHAFFKRTLITKCQFEFEQNVANKNTTEAALQPLMAKMKEFQEKNDMNGVNEVKAQITEEESILRRRLVSTVRFIGELYKLDMLTTNIMGVCISVLLREAAPNQSNPAQANEKLECLCKLLTTVGGKLETKSNDKAAPNLDLTKYFCQLKLIADNKIRNFKTVTRIK